MIPITGKTAYEQWLEGAMRPLTRGLEDISGENDERKEHQHEDEHERQRLLRQGIPTPLLDGDTPEPSAVVATEFTEEEMEVRYGEDAEAYVRRLSATRAASRGRDRARSGQPDRGR